MSRRFETLSLEVADGIATLTLDRADRRNAVNKAMNRELPLAWAAIEADPAVRAVIVTGAGDKAFCTGADLADQPIPNDPELARSIRSISWTGRQNGCTKPFIAAVNGMAVGGGIHFIADADIVIASDQARLIDTHVAVGFVAGLEPVSLVHRMPLGAVMKLALTGGDERLDATEAHRLGLFDEVLPAAQVMPRCRALAANIARHSPTAVARSRAAIWNALEQPLSQALEEAWRLIMRQNDHPDASEGVQAFLDKRAPVWQERTLGDLA